MSGDPSAEIVDGDHAVGIPVEPVRQAGRGRLVDHPEDVQTGDAGGILRRLTLMVVEMGRDRDDAFRDGLAEKWPRRSLPDRPGCDSTLARG